MKYDPKSASLQTLDLTPSSFFILTSSIFLFLISYFLFLFTIPFSRASSSTFSSTHTAK